jgi:hypothetical protein
VQIRIQNYIIALRKINKLQKSIPPPKINQNQTFMFLARSVLSYGYEAWTIRMQKESHIISAEIKFLRKAAGCSLLGYKSNELLIVTQKLTIAPTAQHSTTHTHNSTEQNGRSV